MTFSSANWTARATSCGPRRWAGWIHDQSLGIALDSVGNISLFGFFQGTADFDPSAGLVNLMSAGGDDLFVARFTNSGSLAWAKAMGGTDSERAIHLALDGSGSVLSTGYFNGTADFDPGVGVFNLTSAGGKDIFAKLNSAGNFVWARRMGGTGELTPCRDLRRPPTLRSWGVWRAIRLQQAP
jgi:hypothetical protein